MQPADAAITSVSVMEIEYGIARLAPGKRQRNLAELFASFADDTISRILSFDRSAAEATARYMADRQRAGRPLRDIRDAQIAGIALTLSRRGSTRLATRNVADFALLEVQVVNPWEFSA